MSRRVGGRALAVLVGAWAAWGCATDLVRVEGGFRHRRHGYSIAAPPSPWKRVHVDHSVIAYRGPGPATMSLQSRCGRPMAEPAVLARHLLIGLDQRALRQAGPVEVGGRAGWVQTFDTRGSASIVRVKTVTVAAGECALDWVLTARQGFEAAEPDFDAWVASVRFDASLAEERP